MQMLMITSSLKDFLNNDVTYLRQTYVCSDCTAGNKSFLH